MDNFPSSLSPKELFDRVEYIEITNGIPFKDGQELWEFVLHAFTTFEIARFPILGIEDSGKTRVYMLLQDKERGHSTHAALNNKLHNPIDDGRLIFATAIEGFTHSPDVKSDARIPYLEVTYSANGKEETVHLLLGSTSDFVEHTGSDFNKIGKGLIKKIFERKGIKAVRC